MAKALKGDVAAYAQDARGVRGHVSKFEEEEFYSGMRQNAIGHEAADADADGMLDFAEFSKLIRDREEGHHSNSSSPSAAAYSRAATRSASSSAARGSRIRTGPTASTPGPRVRGSDPCYARRAWEGR